MPQVCDHLDPLFMACGETACYDQGMCGGPNSQQGRERGTDWSLVVPSKGTVTERSPTGPYLHNGPPLSNSATLGTKPLAMGLGGRGT